MNIRLCISIILIGATTLLIGQPINTVKYADMLTQADERIEDGDYFNALDWYRQAYRENKSSDVAMSIAYAYYKLRDYENANRYYSRILDEDDPDNVFIDDRYAYGRSLRAVDDRGKAQIQFELITELSTDKELADLAQIELTGMSEAGDLPKNEDVLVAFVDGDINSGSGEYSPVQYEDGTLYFSSFDRNKEIVIDGKEKDYHAKIYRSELTDKGYGKPDELDQAINRDGFHVGNVTFSEDFRRMYYTRQLLTNDDITSSTIYYSDMGDEDWGSANPLSSVNGQWIAKQPSVGELLGRKVLFFVSDMEGGQGGDDIYYANLSGDNVGPPVNLGPEINTPYDDITPHYHEGVLYFSTEARSGIGGYDIYQSTWDGTNWSTPANMGASYNTRFDDFYLYYNKAGDSGYLVSNRPDEKKKKLKSETCCYDIYNFNIKQLRIDLLVGVGTEDEEPLNGATVELADFTSYETPESKTLPEEFRFDFDLNPERKYQVITSKEGFISDTLEFNTNGIIEDKQIRKKVLLKKLPPPLPTYRIDTVTINEAIRFDNIYYEFDKWDILQESEEDLTIILGLMNEYSDMVVELSSHTDSRGPTPYNEELSQRRAESAKTWLVDKGVASDRIQAKGYGEGKILNRCINGVRCPDEEHRFNRRTEFKILEGPESIEIKREIKTEYDGGSQSKVNLKMPRIFMDSVPVMSFDQAMIDLGSLRQGDKRHVSYRFTNTGTVPLLIELATTCKCTDITWPTEPVLPGAVGEINATFDSTEMPIGRHQKTIDIIANTDPIVVEAKFIVEVLPSE